MLVPIPRRNPATKDIELLARSLRERVRATRVGLDMSELSTVSTSLVTDLLLLHRRIQEAGGRLFLFALNPLVRASLHRLRLEQVFQILE